MCFFAEPIFLNAIIDRLNTLVFNINLFKSLFYALFLYSLFCLIQAIRLFNLLDYYPGPDSRFISWLIAIPYSYHSPDSYVDTNIKGTLNIIQAAKDLNIERILVTSTSEIYGTAKYVPIDENHPKQPQSPYSASKIGADCMADSFYRSFDMPITIVRPFNTYGPRQSARAIIPTIITQLLNGFEEIIIKRLQFNEAQTSHYTTLVKQHSTAIREKDAKIRDSKKNLYSLLTNDDIAKTKEDSIVSQLGVLQKDIEMLHFKHFQDIKKICNPSQKEAFNKLAVNLATLFKPKNRKSKK